MFVHRSGGALQNDFFGYIFGIRSERQLEKETLSNTTYRWFLGLKLIDRVPEISWNRRKRFRDKDIL